MLNVSFIQIDRRRQDVDADAARRTATTTTCGSHPTNPNRMIEANDGGANVSVNGGETWTDQDDADGAVLPRDHDRRTCRITSAARSRTTARRACRASRPAAASAGGGADRVFYSVGGGESGYIANDPRNPDIFYAGSYGGLITRFDRQDRPAARSQSVSRQSDGLRVEGHRRALPVDVPDRVSRRPIPRVLYVGSQHVWKRRTKARAGRGSART